MEKIKSNSLKGQSNIYDEIRIRCRAAVDRIGGVRRFAETIGEDEKVWYNRLTEGRVAGFEIPWMIQVLETTGDHRVLIPFFMRGNTVNVDLLDRLCKALKYFIFPCERDQEGSTDFTVSNLLRGAEKLLNQKRRLRILEGR